MRHMLLLQTGWNSVDDEDNQDDVIRRIESLGSRLEDDSTSLKKQHVTHSA